MDIGSLLASTVIFLFAANGESAIGTAFIIGYPVLDKPGLYIPLVVTAKHVIGDRSQVLGRFTGQTDGKLVRVLYDMDLLKKSGDLWVHPDDGVDIVVFRSQNFQDAKYQTLPVALVASENDFVSQDIKATDRIIFPSLLLNFMGTTKNYPVIRDGTIALIPEEPVPMSYMVGTRKVETQQKVLLIDGTSVPGASGSPVFLWPGPRLKNGAFSVGGEQPYLLGIMHGFYGSQARETIETSSKTYFAENSRIAIVFPSWRLKEILESVPLKKRMEEISAEKH